MNFETIKSKCSPILEWDYSLYREYVHFLGALSIISHLGFYLLLKYGYGYVENEWLRFGSMVLLLGFFLIPKKGELNISKKLYVELTCFIHTPLLFSYHMLANGTNIYWFCSITFGTLVYGLLSQSIFALIGYILSSFVLLQIVDSINLFPNLNYELSLLAYCVGLLMLIIAVVIKFMIISSSKKIIGLEVSKNKLKQLEENFLRLEQRDRLISAFTRPSILTEVSLGSDPTKYAPRRKNISVLFADIMNYTGITEKQSLEECYEYLNNYFELLSGPIYDHFGEIDKLMGDALMATFIDVDNCFEACLALRRNVSAYNRKRMTEGRTLIKFGSGLAFGEVLSGNFGSKEKIDRTIIGDVVNTCARLESLTRQFQVNVLATGDVIHRLTNAECTRLIAFADVKGKKDKVEVYEVYGYEKDEVIDLKNKQKNLLHESVWLHRKGNFTDALKIIRQLINECPDHTCRKGILMDPFLLICEQTILKSLNNGRAAA